MQQFEGDEEKPLIVVFALDVDADTPANLAKILPELGDNVIRIAAGKGETPITKYIKNELRFGQFPHQKDGAWEYDSNLILLDHENKIRGWRHDDKNDTSYDFERSARWEKEYAQAKIDHPEKKLTPPPLTTDELRNILAESVRYLIEEK